MKYFVVQRMSNIDDLACDTYATNLNQLFIFSWFLFFSKIVLLLINMGCKIAYENKYKLKNVNGIAIELKKVIFEKNSPSELGL